MKKLFTLLSAFVATIGLASAQCNVTWSLTNAENQLAGTSNEAKITVSDVTYGSGLNQGSVKSYTNKTSGAHEGSGTLFSQKTAKEYTSPLSDGSQDLTLTFSVPEGYAFTPTSLTFFSAADGSGNSHYLDAYVGSVKLANKYKLGRGQEGAKSETYTVSGLDKLEGDITVKFSLYGKTGGTTKGWVIGDVVVAGEFINLNDNREKAPISWDVTSVSLKLRETFNAPVLSNDENLDITYASSNTKVATVDEAGVISLVNGGVGVAIISATYDGEAEGATYLTTSVNTTIEVITNEVHNNVKDPNLQPVGTIELDNLFYADKTSYPAGEIFADDNLVVEGYSKTAQGKVSGTYGGYTFDNSLQVRVVHDPEEEDYITDEFGGGEFGDGTKADETTALKVIPKVNMTLYVFGRRQVVEDVTMQEKTDDEVNNVITINHIFTIHPNDGKSIRCIEAHGVEADHLDQTIHFGMWNGEQHDYAYVITELKLEAGKEYELYAVNTTYHVNGIGYVNLDKDPNLVEFKTNVIEYKENSASQTDGNGFTFSRTGGKLTNGSTKITVDGAEYTPIKMKGLITEDMTQIVYTLAAPAGRIITKATLYAYPSNLKGELSEMYFTEIAGHTFVKGFHPFKDASAVKAFEFDHIMRNSFDIKLHTSQDDDICGVWVVETTHDRHAVAVPTVMLEGESEVTEGIELEGDHRVVFVNPAEDGHDAYFHFDYAPEATTPSQPNPGEDLEGYDEFSLRHAPARAEEVYNPEVITVNGKEFHKVTEKGVEVANLGTLVVLSHNPATGIMSEVKTINVTGNAPETTDIETIATDNTAAEVEYYNLQGIRISNPENGVFIRRQGNNVAKVLVK